MKLAEYKEPIIEDGINVSFLPPGSYIVELHCKKNVLQKKLIKH